MTKRVFTFREATTALALYAFGADRIKSAASVCTHIKGKVNGEYQEASDIEISVELSDEAPPANQEKG